MTTKTLTGSENALVGVYFGLLGGMFKLRRTVWDDMPNYQTKGADVLNDAGEVIGYAHRIYSDGWAVHTKPFAGYVPDSQIIMLGEND